jgi:hypothetical protein
MKSSTMPRNENAGHGGSRTGAYENLTARILHYPADRVKGAALEPGFSPEYLSRQASCARVYAYAALDASRSGHDLADVLAEVASWAAGPDSRSWGDDRDGAA